MNNRNGTFRKLIVWKEACELTLMVYKSTESFPSAEKYGLVSQLRRASSSVMANIAEGNERIKLNDRRHFFIISRSSLVEVDNHIELSYRLKYLNTTDYDQLRSQICKTDYLLKKFIHAQLKKVGNIDIERLSSQSFQSLQS